LQGKNVIACYGIPTDALVDGAYFTTDLFFQAKPGVNPTNVNVGIIPIDKTYYKNDQLSWTSGYGDESALTSATDVGVNSIAAALNVFVV
jgi:hypothetical protein